MRKREFEIDQAERKLRAAVRDLESVSEHLENAKTGARTRAQIEFVLPALRECAERVGELLRATRDRRGA